MNENINLVEILKDAPRGTKLWSPLCGECNFIEIKAKFEYPIVCDAEDKIVLFDEEGKFYHCGECVLFPSKENRDWSSLKYKHFEPFQKVLVAYFCPDLRWKVDLYSHYSSEEDHHHICLSGYSFDDNHIIPYESNEDKVGKPIE